MASSILADGYGLFWNSEGGDRKYNAESFENWLKKFFTSGVFANDLQVVEDTGMSVQVNPGYANTDGKVGFFSDDTPITLDTAHSTYDRIDTIVVERNDVNREITIHKVTGAYSGNTPVPTAPVRSNGVYQLVLAEIYVAAGVSEVTQADITDKREDSNVCGYITGTVTEIDFSQITAQFDAYYAQFRQQNLAEFDAWFQHMKDQLDTDAAGHLQGEIGNLEDLTTSVKTNLVAAINALKSIADSLSSGKVDVSTYNTAIEGIASSISSLSTNKANNDFTGVTGTLDTSHGGTGQTSLQATRNAMGLGNTTGALPIANGGTGKTTAEDARTNLGLHDAAIKYVANNLTTTDANHVLDARQGKALLDKINTWSNQGRCYKGSSNVQLDITKKTTLFVYAVSGSTYYHAVEIFPTDFLTANFRNQNEGNAFVWTAGAAGGWAKVFFTVSATGVLSVYDSGSSASGVWVPSITAFQK